jgi:hypothetical protein
MQQTRELIERTTRETQELIAKMDDNMMKILGKIYEKVS